MGDATRAFADLISTARRGKGMSQGDLEAASGVSRGTISRWERGLTDQATADRVRAVCKVLGIDPRRAAVTLGYLTEEEVSGQVSAEVATVLEILADPLLPANVRAEWIEYLKYLHGRTRAQAS